MSSRSSDDYNHSSPAEVVYKPIPSPAWLVAALRREGAAFLCGAGVSLAAPPAPGAPRLQLQNAGSGLWLYAPGRSSAALTHGDVASNGEAFKWTLVVLPPAAPPADGSAPPPPRYALQNTFGHFLRADANDGGFMNMATVKRVDCSSEPKAQLWEEFRLAAHPAVPSSLTIYSTHGYFVGHHNGNPTNRALIAGDAESWLVHACT